MRPVVLFATVSILWLALTLTLFVGAIFGDCKVGNGWCFAVHENAQIFLLVSLVAQLVVTIVFAIRQVGK